MGGGWREWDWRAGARLVGAVLVCCLGVLAAFAVGSFKRIRRGHGGDDQRGDVAVSS